MLLISQGLSAVYREPTGPRGVKLEERPRTPVEAGYVTVEVKAASLNHLDLWIAMGAQRTPPPRVLCADGSGVVAESTDPAWKAGDEVVIYPVTCCWECDACRAGRQVECPQFGIAGEHGDGTACQLVHVPVRNLFPKPQGLSWTEAAAFPLTFLTAWRMLTTRARLQPDETLLVVGAGAGVAAAAIAIGKHLGARVLATSRSEEKRRRALDLGADAAFDSTGFSKAVRESAGGGGVDVVFEHVGPATLDESLRSLKKGGRLVFCGSTAGPRRRSCCPGCFSTRSTFSARPWATPASSSRSWVRSGEGSGRRSTPCSHSATWSRRWSTSIAPSSSARWSCKSQPDASPRILLTNDDGITSPGLYALYRQLKRLGDVTVVAPDAERSAVGHAITTVTPLRVKEFRRGRRLLGYAINGTPADCVKIGLGSIYKPHRPDIVVSGINLGPNTAANIIYSGTVSAATEARILGVPSIAVSLGTFRNPEWTFAALVGRRVAAMVLKRGLPPKVLLNVNVPNLPRSEIKGVRITHQGDSLFVEDYTVREDPRQQPYYWLAGSYQMRDQDPAADARALEDGYVSITPVTFDLTAHEMLDDLAAWGWRI